MRWVLMPTRRRSARSAWLLAVICSAILCGHLAAQSPTVVPQAHISARTVQVPVLDARDLRFGRLSTSHGLPQMRVSQIVQDNKGFMWFGTQLGLNRYDGYTLKAFLHDPSNPGSLSGVYIYSLFKDHDGTLWVGCDRFLDKWNPATETFTHYRIPNSISASPPPVTRISQDLEGTLWLATSSGLYAFDSRTGNFRQFHHDVIDPFSLSSDDIKSAGEDREGRFWVATREGLDQFDRAAGKITFHVPLHELREVSFIEDRSRLFWIIYASGNGLARLDRESQTLTRYSFQSHPFPDTSLSGITATLEDRDGDLWFGTQGSGLLKFDAVHQRFIRYENHGEGRDDLDENNVNSLFEDSEGSIWVGLSGSPPNLFSPKPPAFHSLPRVYSNPNGISDKMVTAVMQDIRGVVWIGTNGAMNRLDPQTGSESSFKEKGADAMSHVISITEGSSGTLWFGTFGEGLKRFDPKTGAFHTFRHDPSDPNSLSNDIVADLFFEAPNYLWIATWDGIDRFNIKTNQFTTYKADSQGGSDLYIKMKQDLQGVLWIGSHYSGLFQFDRVAQRFTAYRHRGDDDGSLSDDRVNSVFIDRSGVLWAATQNGLDRFDRTTRKFKAYFEKDGLPSSAISCILEDAIGHLWMSTNNGLSQFDSRNGTFKNYSVADGLPGSDLTGWASCFENSNGEMFFGGFSGGVAFKPERVSDKFYSPRVVFTDFRGSSSAQHRGRLLRTESVTYANSLSIPYDQRNFSLEFSALNYSSPSTTRYRYELDGLDGQWNEVNSDQRRVNYTSLPPGKYVFRVQATTQRGGWNNSGAAINIRVLPPFWSTWWFRTIYILFCALFIWAAYRYRVRYILRQYQVRFEDRVIERTRIARDLHDTLLQTIQSCEWAAEDALDPSNDATGVRRAMEQLSVWLKQATQEGRAALNSLRTTTIKKNDLVEAFRRAVGGCRKQTSMEASYIVVGEAKDIHPIVRDEVYRIGYEAIRNACMHSLASQLGVVVTYAKDLTVTVHDNGVGIDSEVLDCGKEGHFGLRGIRERATRIGAEVSIISFANSGTEVTLIVPGNIAFPNAATSPWKKFEAIMRGMGRPSQSDKN